MATYYISPYGHDSNNGLGKHPNGTTDRPWRTLKKALETGRLLAGDTVYVAPGDYGGIITVAYTGTSDDDAGRIKIYGDPRNEQGFTTDGINLIKAGYCNILERTNRVSKFAAATGHLLYLNGKNYITFKYLNFNRNYYGGSAYYTINTFNTCLNIYFDSCCIFSPNTGFYIQGGADTALNWSITNCIIFSNSHGILIAPTNPTIDTNLNFVIKNCKIISLAGSCLYLNHTATGASLGAVIRNCTCFSSYLSGVIRYGTSAYVGTQVLTVSNCFIWNGSSLAFGATTSGQIVSNNCYYGSTLGNHNKGLNDVNVNGGATVDSDISIIFELGQAALWGFQPKPFLTPLGLPGIGASSLTASMPTTDLLGKPRGAGGGIRPWLDYGINYIGTGSNSTSNTISASISTFTTNQWTGFKLRTITGSSSTGGQQRIITSNNSNVLTVFPNWQVNPVSGSTVYDIVNEAGNGLVQCGVASSATSNTIVDSTKNWITNAYTNLYCAITDNTGSGQNRVIVSNDATSLTVYPTWNITPALYSRFIIYGKDNITGSISGSAISGSLTIMSQSFYPGVFTGYKVKITGGTGIGQERFISDNSTSSLVNAVSMSVLTCTPDWSASVFPVMNDTYRIYNPAIDYAVGCYELNDTGEQDSGSITVDNGSCIRLTGPSNQEIWVPVNATPYTASIRGRYDINHGSNNPPQVALLDNLKIGVSGSVSTLVGSIVGGNNISDWEAVTFTFYPTSTGWVKFRLISRAASGFGNAYFDTFST